MDQINLLVARQQSGYTNPSQYLKGKIMQRFLTKEKTPIELVADEMSHELYFKVTREQAMERLCNQYLNNRLKPSKADATKEKK